MKIALASFLINHAVNASLEFQRQVADKVAQSKLKARHNKTMAPLAKDKKVQSPALTPSSAYQVSISQAAMQKLAASSHL